jgi:HEAT repeat protein
MRSRALAAIVVASLAGGCRRGGPSVSGLQVAAGAHDAELRGAGLDRDVMREAARAALRGAGFRVEEERGDYRARVEVLTAEDASPWDDAVSVEVELQLSGSVREITEVGVGRVPAPGSGRTPAAAWRAAFSAAVADASSGVRRALAAEGKPTQELIRELEAEDAAIRVQAIRVLGDRRSREAVPALIARLREPDVRVAERAAGALAQIGDPRAVAPIIDFTHRLEDGPYAPRYARIIGDIGGSEARGYLMTIESGHGDPRIRQAAREALADLEVREREQAERTRTSPPRSASRDSGRMER